MIKDFASRAHAEAAVALLVEANGRDENTRYLIGAITGDINKGFWIEKQTISCMAEDWDHPHATLISEDGPEMIDARQTIRQRDSGGW